jgi:streptogramin lyase
MSKEHMNGTRQRIAGPKSNTKQEAATLETATETETMYSPSQRNTMMKVERRKAAAAAAVLLGMAAVLTGCATNGASVAGTGTATGGALKVSGKVFGGQQPVSGATVQLYTVGTSGLQSASTSLIASPPLSGTDGSFDITGTYSCASATQVYLVATGGSSLPGSTNSAITLVAALGPCSTLLANAATTTIIVNEVTTVAAAYALAPFATDYLHVGAPATVSGTTGMGLAMSNAALLANTTSGSAGGASIPDGVTVPTAELNTLGNILAACINTTGPASTGCSAVLGATGATDTFSAALGMAKNPGAAAVTALYAQSTAQAPFQPSLVLTTAPKDFTVAVSVAGTGNALATPYGIAIDSVGDAWVANESGNTVTVFSPVGSQTANQGATGLVGPQGVAIDNSGNVWVANTAGNSAIKFATSAGGVITGTSIYTVGGLSAPVAVSIDQAGDAWFANFNGNSVTELNSAGASMNGSPLTAGGGISVPSGIMVSPAGVFVTSGSGSVLKLSSSGALVSTLNDGTLQGPVAVSVDSTGRVVASGFTTGTVVGGGLAEFDSTGTAVAVSPVTSGLTSPAGVTTDGSSLWVANSVSGGGLLQYTYGSATPVSPMAGYGSLGTPVGVATDASGSVWTTNSGTNTVTKFIGLGAPTVTPLVASFPVI